MRVPFRLVDVFTQTPFAGNQLCVVSDGPALSEETMQMLAREIGFSETTYVTEAGGDRYAMRIFTPDEELPFAGHPTLGTAFVLVSEDRVSSPAIQIVKAGEIPVEVDLGRGFAWMRQLPPEFGREVDDPDAVSTAVPVKDFEAVARASLQPTRVEQLVGPFAGDGVYVFAEGDGYVKARMLAPGTTIGEDPATGSAAGPLGAYLAARGLAGMPGSVVIRQGEHVGRPSQLHVTVEPEGDSWAIRVGGGVRVVGQGAFEL